LPLPLPSELPWTLPLSVLTLADEDDRRRMMGTKNSGRSVLMPAASKRFECRS
jgi:hypothetical protein